VVIEPELMRSVMRVNLFFGPRSIWGIKKYEIGLFAAVDHPFEVATFDSSTFKLG
jgi:hypothetical protein